MQIHVSPRNIPLTASIHSAVATHIGQLEGHGTELLAAHVVLMHADTAVPGERYRVKVHLAVAGPDIHAEHAASDLYVALEGVTDKLSRQMRKRKTAISKKSRAVTQKAVESQRTTGEIPRVLKKGMKALGPSETRRTGIARTA
jgi:putative sigma-54 modulation protein